ncbi:MAG TPA: hemerythrin domain-containing protein [Burkholderiales bacterium]|nr:hemerythrin domain-containing protein [Burkholderiales bacterium]
MIGAARPKCLSPTQITETTMPRTTTATRTTRTQTALDLLKADHAEAKKLFRQFEKLKKSEDTDGMQQVAQTICDALRVHAQIEEEIFYPALREAGDADDALDEADVEHSHVKELVEQIASSGPGDEHFEARVKVLSEYVEHHVQEEESTIFSKARKADFDLVALGQQLEARKAELKGEEPPVDVAALAGREQAMQKRNGQRAKRQS